jgi:hypothetical protein
MSEHPEEVFTLAFEFFKESYSGAVKEVTL